MSEELFQNVEDLIEKLKLPKDFYYDLINESDWAIVIKLSALIETISTNLLAYKFSAPDLEGNFAYLDQAHSKIGRITLLKKMGSINSQQAKVLLAVAELRNSLAHNIENLNFQFDKYISSLNKDQKKQFVKKFGYDYRDFFIVNDNKTSRYDYVINNPKDVIWNIVAEILACMQLDYKISDYAKKNEVLSNYIDLT